MPSPADQTASGSGAPLAHRLGRLDPYWWLVAPLLIVTIGLFLVPLFNILLLSVTDPEPGLQNYERLATASAPMRVFMTTLRICAVTTVIAIVLGYCVAYAMAHLEGLHQRLLLVAVLIPLWVSVLVRAFSWLVLLRDQGPVNDWLIGAGLIDEPLKLVRNELGVVIGMVHYLIPYAVLPIYAVMRGLDNRLLFASRSLGASPATTFFRVYLPLTLPGVFAAMVIVFVFGLGFYVTPAVLGGGRVVMLAESVSVAILQTVRWGYGAAQSVVLLVLTLILIGIMGRTVGLKRGFG
ncbi:ABC transporter permease [Zavarzinia compransoris]|uniref:ABC transporter permease n=1 Tax=Zavarzinia marina TaxID=2911065 RepID=UPI001F329C52|nr:ABC transporter permease [Zavarzinia marina]MCF4166310.1 ABC transporter permease [Zavarzinia marina]